jgi:hypothetical protein
MLKVRCNKRSASTGRPTPPFVEGEALFLKHVHVQEKIKSSSKVSPRPEARNGCADEDQQQFNRPKKLVRCEPTVIK